MHCPRAPGRRTDRGRIGGARQEAGDRNAGLPGEGSQALATGELGQCYLERGDGGTAAEWFQRCADIAIRHVEGMEHAYYCMIDRVKALEMAGDLEGAIAAMREVIQLVEANEKRLSQNASLPKLRERLAELERKKAEKEGQ